MKQPPPLWLVLGCVFALLLAAPHWLRLGQGETDLRFFWNMGQVAQIHGPGAVYDRQLVFEQTSSTEAFFYPPTALLLLTPLWASDYALFFTRWLMLTALIYLAAVWLAAPLLQTRSLNRVSVLCVALCYGGLAQSLFYGQFSAIFAALWLVLFWLYARWPQLGALPLTLLSVKPHLGVMLPLLLLWQRRWGLFIAACLCCGLLITLSIGLWGEQPWLGYLFAVQDIIGRTAASELLHNPSAPSSLYYGLRRLGLSPTPALAAQLVVGFTALTALWHQRRRLAGAAQLALLPIATLLLVPHWYPYDLAILILPLLALLPLLLQPQTQWFDRALWLLCFCLPPLSDALNAKTGLGPWPLLLPLLLWRGSALLARANAAK